MTYFTKPFFTLVFAIADIYPLVILLDVIGIIMILFKEKFEPLLEQDHDDAYHIE